MRALVNRQRLGFVASVGIDGAPHVAAQGSLAVWAHDTLVFADVVSGGTVRNLLENPATEVAVVDPLERRGWRFRGSARLLLSGPTFDRLQRFYRRRGVVTAVQHMVLIQVERIEPLVSPVYSQGWSAAAVRERWVRYWRQDLAPLPRRGRP